MKRISLRLDPKTAFFACALLFSSLACAQGSGTSGAEAVTTVLNMILEKPGEMASTGLFRDAGKWLLTAILSILFSWKMVKILFDGAGINQIVGELVNIILLFGIASFFMDASVQKEIADGFDQLAATAAGSGGGSIASQLTANVGKMAAAAFDIYEGTPPESAGSWWSEAWGSVKSGTMFASLANVFFRIAIAILLLLSVLIYCAQIIFSQIMVNIGLIMAPLFVPWLLWEVSNEFFYGWLKFMITAGLQKIVGALLFGMVSSFVSQITALASDANANPGTNFYYYAACFLVTAIAAYLMMQISTIANGLVSGAARSSFTPPRALQPGGGLGRASNMAHAGAGAVGKAASAVKNSPLGKYAGGKMAAAGSALKGAATAGANRAYQGARGVISGGGSSASSAAPPVLPKAGGKP